MTSVICFVFQRRSSKSSITFSFLYCVLIETRQPKPGVDQGPIHLVEAGLIKQIENLGWKVKFDGHHQFEGINAADDPPIGILKNPRLVSCVTQSVAQVVAGHVAKGELPVTLGGDHSLVHTE